MKQLLILAIFFSWAWLPGCSRTRQPNFVVPYTDDELKCIGVEHAKADAKLGACSAQAGGLCPKWQRDVIEEATVKSVLGCVEGGK